jgi:hypothetical protein
MENLPPLFPKGKQANVFLLEGLSMSFIVG